MTQYVLFPDVEQALIDYLGLLLGVPCKGRVPKPRPPRFLRIERTGGDDVNVVVEEASVLVEAWAATDAQAAQLAQRARAAIKAIDRVGDVVFYRVRAFSTPQNLPDPTTDQARYTALYALRVRGAATTTL